MEQYTPLLKSEELTILSGVKNVYLKLENCQPTGSFKDRGMKVVCRDIASKGFKGIACSSGGNAGLAAAHAASKENLLVDIFVPITTKQNIVNRLRKLGANVHVGGSEWKEADKEAREFCTKHDRQYVSPFDDQRLWDGHATLIDELANQLEEKPDIIVLSVGGGGLAAGVLTGLLRSKWGNSVDLILCETTGTASLASALKEGKPVSIGSISSIATSLGATQVSEGAFKLIKDAGDHIYSEVVTDHEAIDGCMFLANEHRMLVEPACGASVAGWRKYYDNNQLKISKESNVVIIVCGGSGINFETLKQYENMLQQ